MIHLTCTVIRALSSECSGSTSHPYIKSISCCIVIYSDSTWFMKHILNVLAFDQIGKFITHFIAKYVSHVLKTRQLQEGRNRRALPPEPLTRGFAPGFHCGHGPDPYIGLRSALAMDRSPQLSNRGFAPLTLIRRIRSARTRAYCWGPVMLAKEIKCVLR